MEDVTDAYYKHTQKVWENFETFKKKVGVYHDL